MIQRAAFFFFLLAITPLSRFALANTGASSNSLAAFGKQVESQLNSSSFCAEIFCHRFWLKSQASVCTAIPWDYVVHNGVVLQKVISVQENDLGFLVVELKGTMAQLFSVTRDGKDLYLSLDHPKVWGKYTSTWIAEGRLKFSSSVQNATVRELREAIETFDQRVRNTFGVHQPLSLPFYFVNAEKDALELGLQWNQNKLGGGARDGFILIIGDIQKNLRSILLHEMVHSYTNYPGEFWQGPGVFPNALLSEGLATWVQIPQAWNDEVPKEVMAKALCHDIENVRHKMKTHFFDLIDNTNFRTFDGQNGSFKSGYLAGAALIDALLKSGQLDLEHAAFKTLWNKVGQQTSPQDIESVITGEISEAELLERMEQYLDGLETEISNKTSLTCRPASHRQ